MKFLLASRAIRTATALERQPSTIPKTEAVIAWRRGIGWIA